MLIIDRAPKFWTTVKVRLGEEPEQSFRARFLALEVEAYNTHDLADEPGVRAFLEDVLVGLDEVVGEDGSASPFASAKAVLLSGPHTRAALVRAYHAGIAQAALGN